MPLVHTWLPAATPESLNPLQIIAANGSYIYTSDQQRLYDAISSWWCKPLGHRHPLVIQSLHEQLRHFEHHIPANAYNATIEKLSTLLVNIFNEMDKVIYACDGSSAVEIAMKLSYETRVLQGNPERSKYLALRGAYHGETIFTLGVCGIEGYKDNYAALISQNFFIDNIVYVTSPQDPQWDNPKCDFSSIEQFFATHAHEISALLIEPLVQGAAGLKIISRAYLLRIIEIAKHYQIHIIADEIMVGLGRLGVLSVTKEIMHVEADLVLFAKNLTAGSIPMSCVVVNRRISEIYRNYQQIFPHSHTHSCNALGAAVAVNYIELLQNSNLLTSVRQAEKILIEFNHKLMHEFDFIITSRAIGVIAAWELNLPQEQLKQIASHAQQLGIYLRPIANVVYILIPLYNVLDDLQYILPKIEELFKSIRNFYKISQNNE
jgi:adenosylmethionine-8-amino-7-oxononanoate aminotransferase